jgi:hypothetical protein
MANGGNGTNDGDRSALRREYAGLIQNLRQIDDRYRLLLGDEYDMMQGAGVHRAAEEIDREFARIYRKESAIKERLEFVCAALNQAGEAVARPSERKYGSSGPYVRFWRDDL